MIETINIGDRITFRALTRWSNEKATRVVNGFWLNSSNPTVRYGCGNFVVRLDEIISIEKGALRNDKQ